MTAKNTKPKVNIDLGTVLLITGALANVTLWVGAFSSTEATGPVSDWIKNILMPILGSVAGFAMGVTAVSGLVLVLWRLSAMQPTYERKVRGKDEYKTYVNYRYWITVGVMVLLLVVSWALLSPFEFGRMKGTTSLYEILGETWSRWWAFGRVLAADLILAGVALVSGSHPGANRSATAADGNNSLSDGSSKTTNRSAAGSGRTAKLAKTVKIVACRYAGAGCERTGTQNAMNSHAGRCKFKPTVGFQIDGAAIGLEPQKKDVK